MNISRKIEGHFVEIRNNAVYDVYIGNEWERSSNSLENIQADLFELFYSKLFQHERNTERVMKIYFDIQLLIDICRQEFGLR